MGSGENFLFFVLLVISWTYASGMANYEIVSMPIESETSIHESEISESVERHEQMCALCEKFTAQAIYYLGENKTQDEIIDTLLQACSLRPSFEEQCIILVDFYARLFFVEIATIHPDDFCRKVNLCEETIHVALPKGNETCTLCHRVVVEVLTKLKDPDTQLGIIELLLKECSKMGHYAKKCKRLIFQYGPLILANGEKFLETTDVCASIHVCGASQAAAVGTSILADTSIVDAELGRAEVMDA